MSTNDPAPSIDKPHALPSEVLDDKPIVAPDQVDEKYRTTKYEVWAYYACVMNKPAMELPLTVTML